MATNRFKKIDQTKPTATEVQKHNLAVMMPFIKFGFGAMKLIAHTLLFIVKAVPKLHDEKPENKSTGRIIKIK